MKKVPDVAPLFFQPWPGLCDESGGAKRDRTADLYNAIVALSQLSYSPPKSPHHRAFGIRL